MIKVVITDIDGVLTDGKVRIDARGEESKSLCYADLDAVGEMKRCGLKIAMITGEDTPITRIFEAKFAPDHFFAGCKDKLGALDSILAAENVSDDEVCYTGDGLYDIPVLKRLKYASCPSDAIPGARESAAVHLDCRGGDGCMRALFEYLKNNKLIVPYS